MITLIADVIASTGADSFTFAYSRDDSSYSDLFSVSASTSGAKLATLPSDLNGTVYIRVMDNVRNSGNVTSHEVQVDHLTIRSEKGSVMPAPTAPESLYASAAGSDQITLDWVDTSDNEFGFNVERRLDSAGQWERVATTGVNGNTYTDIGLQPGTLYHYRVRAFNSAGTSAYSASASAQTEEGQGAAVDISLSVTSYKVKGSQVADLSWSGASSTTVDIYRDGSLIDGQVANSGAFTDDIGQKGGGGYQYEVCEAGTNTCSPAANADF
jgi:hypothetical protein